MSNINAVHINAARKMVSVHTSGRAPPNQQRTETTQTAQIAQTQSTFIRPTNIQVPSPNAQHAQANCNNPQCANCGTVIIPSPKATLPIRDTPSISVNGWDIQTIKNPILSAFEIDEYENLLKFPIPEMIFGNNKLIITNNEHKIKVEFSCLDAMLSIDPQSNLKVSYHKEWANSRNKVEELSLFKDFDWTYSSNYKSTAQIPNFKLDNTAKIPIDRLIKPDPILFFDELVLYEDELGDNGISILSIKVRVMPTFVFILQRFFLRIDNVIFRVRDTRYFIDFNTNKVICEYKEQEQEYDAVVGIAKSKSIGGKDYTGLLRDSNWISGVLPVLSCEVYSNIDE